MNPLEALQLLRSNAAIRLSEASSQGEIYLRTVWIAQLDREIASEIAFIGKKDDMPEMSDDELLAALGL